MPINSVSGVLSTSVYLVAMLLLLVVIAGPAKASYDAASLRSAQEMASGIATQVDALSPGMESILEISSMPGTTISVSFSDSEVTVTVNGVAASSPLNWPVTGPVLEGGSDYPAALDGGVVRVA